MSKSLALLALLTPLAAAAAADGAAVSATPYLALYQVLAPARSIRAYDRLIAVERVQSKSPDVRAQDIHITIRARRGAIAVPVAADGAVDFPADEALQAENPPVETNQPKGSLMLTVHAALRVPDALEMPWSEVDAGLRQAEELFARTPGGSAQDAKPRGVEIRFAPGDTASVTLAGRSERLLQSDADGRVLVTRDMVVESERPVLKFSRRPLRILPYVDD
ncbi:hypothetical protein [Dokdonella ginsengisoli]|uniref:DUF2987 domain-containing protein n=1 Tax=Dokdonella ginsengisoli TaxID=363846 RepID=A0ABV9QQZ7_9GAMM